MAHQLGRAAPEESSDESDDDYVPPEQVEVEDDESDSAGADLEPSSGGDTDLDVCKRKRKRKVRGRTVRTKKKPRTDDTSDNNDETTSNETLLSLPLRGSLANVFSPGTTSDSKSGGDQSSTPSPTGLVTSESEAAPPARSKPLISSITPLLSSTTTKLQPPKPDSNVRDAAPKSGLGSMLAKLSGKKKATTLEKSQMDWKNFKSANQIEEELAQHNKGKGGFLDRKDFLERSSVREYQFSKNGQSGSSRHD